MKPLLLALSIVVLGGGADSARIRDEIASILDTLEHSGDPAERVRLARNLARLGTSRSAAILAWLVEEDPDVDVRVAAAEGLGRVEADNALRLLVDLVRRGGPDAVRDALATSLTWREGALEPLLEALRDDRQDDLGKGLIVESLGAFRDERSRRVLLEMAAGEDPYLRGESLRALGRRPDARDALLARIREILGESRDSAALLEAIDSMEEIEDPAFLPLAERLATFLEPEVQRAAEHLRRRLTHLDAVRKRAAAPEGYGTYGDPPPAPPDRARFDVVFALDVTGSTVGELEEVRKRIDLETRLLRTMGCSLRVGVVAYRFWKDISRNVPRTEVLPLTYDARRVEDFLEELRSRGADSQGADVTNGLRQAHARMGWRRNARRLVVLIAEGPCHDPDEARLITGIHFRADRTRTRVLYVLRTRRKVPEIMKELARLGGTGVVELLE